MRWRQVIVLWTVCGALAAGHVALERRPRPVAPSRPARARLLPIGTDDVRELRLERGGRIVLTRREGDRWTVVEPAGAPVPPDLIAAFTSALVGAEQIELVNPSGQDPHAFGFDDGAARVELVLARGSPVVVTIGGTNPTGTAVYARGGNAAGIVLIGRNVRYYEDLIFGSLPPARPPTIEQGLPVGGG